MNHSCGFMIHMKEMHTYLKIKIIVLYIRHSFFTIYLLTQQVMEYFFLIKTKQNKKKRKMEMKSLLNLFPTIILLVLCNSVAHANYKMELVLPLLNCSIHYHLYLLNYFFLNLCCQMARQLVLINQTFADTILIYEKKNLK